MAFCYFKGELIEQSEASLPVNQLGLHRGFGVFDFFRARNKKPTFIDDYLSRFEQSQEFLNLSHIISREEILGAVAQLQGKNKFENSGFKLMLIGDGKDTDTILDPLFFILNTPILPGSVPTEGNLILHEYVREYPLVKSINYLTSYRIHQKKKQASAIDVLYHKDGLVSETSRSNLFIIKGGVLLTPEKDILHGITRKHILKMAEGVIENRIVDISVNDVLTADEVFITSTLKEIMPIVKIDDQIIGDGKPGAQTERLQKQFKAYITDYSN